MALPETGPISLGLVRTELKRSDRISLGDTDVRSLASKPSGMISLSDLRGKSSEVRYANASNRTQANIHTLMGSPTEAGNYIFENTATISAASRGGWALQTGVFPEGSTLTIINRGHIRGGGGDGGNPNTGVGGAGGTALILNFPATINNTSGTIWGGGGGGAGGRGGYSVQTNGNTVTWIGGGDRRGSVV